MQKSSTTCIIHPAKIDDAPAIAAMLGALASEIGDEDRFCTSTETVIQHGFGKMPLFHSLIAEQGEETLGLALFFPVYSTTMATPGLYVQDLWVARAARGTGVGKRLLARAALQGADMWGATYLGLTVYADNPKAARFYKALGFDIFTSENPMRLTRRSFIDLKDIE
ncbi:MAG: GNAT family N-acetyltransferase [Rhodobacteraceae bacterium]|nr:GNAT family N-acetyltransferase [Paracoccaceae bacterium]